MSESHFSTIDEYIASFEDTGRAILQKVRGIILAACPEETKETMSYRMPTFRYHGNLIHFALFKNHLGLYPGSDAIEHYAAELQSFKTSKGAIQIPLDKPLPAELIQKLVYFNVDRLKNKKGPTWDTHRTSWEDAEEFMNQLIVQTKTPLEKAFKWGSDIYTFQGKNVIGWGGFKDFFSLWFYQGVFLEDLDQVLISASEGKTKGLRQWRFTTVQDMDAHQILNYIEESVQTIRDGKEIKIEKGVPKVLEGALKDALTMDVELEKAFQVLSPGRQKEYMEYIEEAKQDKTKLTRIEKIRPIILLGKGLNDKYKK